MTRIYTVGHGARSLEEFIGLLRAAGIGVLCDVRRYPGSRRHPQFGREALAEALADAGISYEWHGEALGGRRSRREDSRHTALHNAAFGGYADHMDTTQFRAALTALVERAESSERLAVMCAETLWWRCHRSLIADALTMRGAEVVHLIRAASQTGVNPVVDIEQQRHRPHPTVRRGEDGWPVYDVSETLF